MFKSPTMGQTLLMLLLLALLGLEAHAESNARVISIKINTTQSSGPVSVQVLRRGERNARSAQLMLNSELRPDDEITIPLGTQIVLRTSNGNELDLRGGTRVRLSIGEAGEAHEIKNGEISFNVVNALSFFNVRFQEFLAAVRGTRFLVSAWPDKEYRCEVSSGKVLLERPVTVKIIQGDRIIDFMASELLEANKRASAIYRIGSRPVEQKFDTPEDAEKYFRKKLDDQSSSSFREFVYLVLAIAEVHWEKGGYGEAEKETRKALVLETTAKKASLTVSPDDQEAFAIARYRNLKYAELGANTLINWEFVRRAEKHLDPALSYWRSTESEKGQAWLANAYRLLGDIATDAIRETPSQRGLLSGMAADYYSRAIEARAQVSKDANDLELTNLKSAYQEQIRIYQQNQPDPAKIEAMKKRVSPR